MVEIEGRKAGSESYCTCGGGYNGDMIACDNKTCKIVWYHVRCLPGKRINLQNLGKEGVQWLCPSCRKVNQRNEVRKAERKRKNKNTYCICKKKSSGNMIACDAPDCSIEWYHVKCIKSKRVNFNKLKDSNRKWICEKCLYKKRKRTKVKKYCTCNKRSYGDMIACDSKTCEVEWYHVKCLKGKEIDFESLRRKRKKWFCPSCEKCMPKAKPLKKVSA